MPDRHKHPPLYFRAAAGDRERLAAHVAQSAGTENAILAAMLTAYLDGLDAASGQTATEVVTPRKASRRAASAAKNPGAGKFACCPHCPHPPRAEGHADRCRRCP